MRKLFLTTLGILIIPVILLGVNKTQTQYTEDTAPTSDDIMETTDDPGGAPATRKVTIGNLPKGMDHTVIGAGIGTDTPATIDTHIDVTDNELSSLPTTYLSISSYTASAVKQETEFAGDVTGKFDTIVVGNDSHDHTTTTLSGITVGDMTADTTGQLTNWDNLSNVSAVLSIRKAGDTLLTGAVTLTGGANVTLTQAGQDISIAAAGGAGITDHGELTSTGTLTHAVIDNEFTSLTTTYLSISSYTASAVKQETEFAGDVSGKYNTILIDAGAVTLAKMTAAATGYGTNWDNATNVSVTSAQILDGTIVTGDMSAATTGFFTNWDNLANVVPNFTGQVLSNSRNVVDQYNFAVTISTPNALGVVATLVSPFRDYAVTITTVSAQIIGGTNDVFMLEWRTIAGIESAGTDIWTGDLTAKPAEWTGGTASDFTGTIGQALVLVRTSGSGDVDRLMIKGTFTKD